MRPWSAFALAGLAISLAVPMRAFPFDDSPCTAQCRAAADSCCHAIIQLCPKAEPCCCVCPPPHRCAVPSFPDDCLPCVTAPCHKPVVACIPDAPCICLPSACHLPATPLTPPAPCLCMPEPGDCALEPPPCPSYDDKPSSDGTTDAASKK